MSEHLLIVLHNKKETYRLESYETDKINLFSTFFLKSVYMAVVPGVIKPFFCWLEWIVFVNDNTLLYWLTMLQPPLHQEVSYIDFVKD